MWTNWYRPNSRSYLQTNEVNYSSGVVDIITDVPVYSLTTDYLDRVSVHGANSILFSNFGIANSGVLNSIVLRLEVRRLDRISDYTIQLYSGGSSIGNNLATPDRSDIKTYGTSLLDWNIDSSVDYTAPDFGVIVDLGPRPDMASSERIVLRSVLIQLELL